MSISLFFWLCGGVLTGASVAMPTFWYLSLLGLVCIFHAYIQTATPRRIWWESFLGLWVHMSIVLSWGWSVADVSTFGLSSTSYQFFVVSVLIITSAAGIALGGAVVHMLVAQAQLPQYVRYVLFPVQVLAAELLGRVFFSGMMLGLDAGLGVSFGFGHVGYALVHHATLRMAAAFGGVYVLTVLLSFLAVLLYAGLCAVASWQYRIVLVVLVMLLLVGTANYALPWRSERVLTEPVALLHTMFKARFDEDAAVVYKAALTKAYSRGASMLIMPENAELYKASRADFVETMSSFSTTTSFRFIETSDGFIGTKRVVRAYLHSSDTATVAMLDKQSLVPVGEYVPIFPGFLLRTLGLGTYIDEFEHTYNYRLNPDNLLAKLPAPYPPVLFCYESSVPYLARQLLMQHPAPYIAHVVSHSWFPKSRILKNQLYDMLAVQAIWANTFILQAGNMAPATVVTPQGDVYAAPLAASEDWQVHLVSDVLNPANKR